VSENGGAASDQPIGLIRDGGQIRVAGPNRNVPGLTFTFDVPLRQPNGNVVPAGQNLAPLFDVAGSVRAKRGDKAVRTTLDWVVGGALVMPAGKTTVAVTARVTDAAVSVPPSRLAAARVAVAGWNAAAVREPGRVAALLGDRAGAVVGPASVAYADARTLRPSDAGAGVRVLDASDPRDVAAVAALRAASPGPDWEHGGGALGPGPAVSAFAGGALAALATYEVWGGRLAHVAVVAHPEYRGRGYAAAAVRTLAGRALARGLVPQYRTLEANAASVRLGAAAGFVPYATSLAVRLRAAGA